MAEQRAEAAEKRTAELGEGVAPDRPHGEYSLVTCLTALNGRQDEPGGHSAGLGFAQGDRRAPSTVAVGDEPPMNPHKTRVQWASKDFRPRFLQPPTPTAPDSQGATTIWYAPWRLRAGPGNEISGAGCG
jgi:hypothetical protein